MWDQITKDKYFPGVCHKEALFWRVPLFVLDWLDAEGRHEDGANVSSQLRKQDLPECCPCCQRNCLTFQDRHLKVNTINYWTEGAPKIKEHKQPPQGFCSKTSLISSWHVKNSDSDSIARDSARLEKEVSQVLPKSSHIPLSGMFSSRGSQSINKTRGVKRG